MLTDLNPLAVLVATVVGFAFGAAWFAPPVFGTRWMASLGKTPEQLGKPGPAMAVTFVMVLINAVTLAVFLRALGIVDAMGGAKVGLLLGVGIVAATMISEAWFTNVPRGALWVQVFYRVLLLVIMGAIEGKIR